jgi:pyruvate/2-oxoglutarate dehydrogenase complex dihydrolipoamide acyltransferase (E2) component
LSSTTLELNAPVHGSVIAIEVQPGQQVAAGTVLLLLEAMKMEVPLEAPCHGEVLSVQVAVGEVASDGEVLVRLRPLDHAPVQAAPAPAAAAAPAGPRADLQRLLDRRALLSDAARPEAMARRHATGLRSARENLADVAGPRQLQRIRRAGRGRAAQPPQPGRPAEAHTPADGQVTGTGTVDGRPVAVLAYDYTVLAGTQGMNNHAKSDRLLDMAARHRCRWCGSWKAAAAARATSTGRAWPGCTAAPLRAGPRCRAWCRASAWWPALLCRQRRAAGLLRPHRRHRIQPASAWAGRP